MSKAFTREDDSESAQAAPAIPRLRPGEVRYLTPQGAAELRKELASLTAEREALAGSPSAAGSRPEAAAAKGRAAEIARRLLQVEAVLGSSTVAQVADAEDRVLFGAWVTLEDEDGSETAFRIVGPDEADARAGKISVDSPLARALLGRVRGEEVSVKLPRGEAAYTIVEVRYLP